VRAHKQLIHVNITKKHDEVDKLRKLLLYVIEEYDIWYNRNPQARKVLLEATKEFNRLKEFGFT